MKKHGFTLIEILIVISILAILLIAFFTSANLQRQKAEDGKAKSDLSLLKIAFENYYNDHNCYPPGTWFDSSDDCGSNQLNPYLQSIPCDKNTGLPYIVETDSTSCEWFKLYAKLNLPNFDDQAIAQRSSSGSTKGNYGASSSNTTVSIFWGPTPSVAISPPPIVHNYYWCSNIGNCSSFDPTIQTCTPYYIDNPNCDDGPTKCSSIGSCIHL